METKEAVGALNIKIVLERINGNRLLGTSAGAIDIDAKANKVIRLARSNAGERNISVLHHFIIPSG